MSTTPSPVAPSVATSSPSSTAQPSPPLSATSTLLFGFLVSALSIFAIFMTSAIIWNRLALRRHTIDAMLTTNHPPLRDPQRLHRPVMWDVWAMPHKQSLPWSDLTPVAAQKCNGPSSSPQTTQPEQTVSFWRHSLVDSLPPEITYLFHRPIPQVPPAPRDTDMSPVELLDGSDIQISLLISMPRPPPSTRGDHEHRQGLHEVVFATTNVSLS